MIKATDLVKRYGDFVAVDGINFNIADGDFFGFLGPNGAGKTTTLRMISCYQLPTSGSINILGLDVKTQASEIKAQIGVVAQDNNLDPDITVIENLIVYAGYYGISKKIALPKAMELLKMVDLVEKKDNKIQALSGGMLRRLQIARSLVNEPKVLILDEPTTGLDPHSRRILWEKLENLRKDMNMTMILTTHYMQEAETLCNRVAIMDHGKIVVTDTPAHLMQTHGGNLEEVYLKLTGRPLDG